MSSRSVRLLGVVAACTAATLVVGCAPASHKNSQSGAKAPAGSAAPTTSAASPTPKPSPLGQPVRASLFEGDGRSYGIGMPIIMKFSRAVLDPKAIEQAIRVTSNPPAAPGAWYWFSKTEAHYRPATYWPGHATITLDAPLKGVSAGPGLSISNNLTLSMHTGAAHISTINATTLKMYVMSDGQHLRVIPVSLGKPGHRTFYGVKVVEERHNPERMISDPPTGPGSYNVLVPWSVRVTNSGEFIHAAPWNPLVGQSDQSHGCTNLNTADAKWFYTFSGVGDVVVTTKGPGMPPMRSWDGWGDWNVPWPTWSAA